MNADSVLSLLKSSLQAGPSQQHAMKALQAMESEPGFVHTLLHILGQDMMAVSMDIKLLSIICLKNIVLRCWAVRTKGAYAVSHQEKALLREFLMHTLSERDVMLSLHFSVLFSKVGRHDWPTEWPSVLVDLYQAIKSAPDLSIRRNAMVYMLRLLRELASKKLSAAKQQFNSLTADMFPALASVWRELDDASKAQLLQPSSKNYPEIESTISQASLVLSIVKILILRSFESISLEPVVGSFFEVLLHQMSFYSAFLRAHAAQACDVARSLRWDDELSEGSDAGDHRDSDDEDAEGDDDAMQVAVPRGDHSELLRVICRLRHLLTLMASIPVKLQKQYPLRFAPYIDPFLRFSILQLTDGYGAIQALDLTSIEPISRSTMNPIRFGELHGFSLQWVLFLSNVFSCGAYSSNPMAAPSNRGRIDPKKADNEKANAMEADAVIERFLGTDITGIGCVDRIMFLLLGALIHPQGRLLEEWFDDPESLLLREEAEREGDSVRTAAQGLFYGIIDRRRPRVKEILRSILFELSQNTQLPWCDGVKSSLTWEAVFLCAGLSGDKLFPSSYDDFAEDDGSSGVAASRSALFASAEEFIHTIVAPIIERLIMQRLGTSIPGGVAADVVSASPELVLRRLLWLLTCWMYLIPSDNIDLWNRICTCIVVAIEGAASAAGSIDLVTGMQAALALQSLCNSDAVDIRIIEGIFPRAAAALCGLTTKYDEQELSSKVVSVISDMVAALAGRSSTSSGIKSTRISEAGMILPLAGHLGQLWESASENSPLRSNILDVLIKLTKCAGKSAHAVPCSCCSQVHSAASQYHDFLIDKIRYAASGRPAVAHLTPQAIELWFMVLRNSDRYTAPMDALFAECIPRLFAVPSTQQSSSYEDEDGDVENCNDSLDVMDLMSSEVQSLFNLIEASIVTYSTYVAEGPPFVIKHASVLQIAFQRVLGQLRAQAVSSLVRPIEILLIVSSEAATEFLFRAEIIHFLLRACFGTPIYDPSPEITALMQTYSTQEEADISIISYLHVIARLMLLAPSVVLSVMGELCQSAGVSQEAGIEMILRHLIEKFDNVGYESSIAGSWRRRLWIFAMLSIFPRPQLSPVNALLPEISANYSSIMSSDPYVDGVTEALLAHLARAALKSAVEDEDEDERGDEDDDNGMFDDVRSSFDADGAESAQAGKGSPLGESKRTKEIVVENFERILARDSVLTVSISSFCSERLALIQHTLGADRFNEIMSVLE
jgi:hypothetical protein